MQHSLPWATFSRNLSSRHAQLVHSSHETCFIIAWSEFIMFAGFDDHDDDKWKR